MKLLAKSEWRLQAMDNVDYIAAGIYEYPPGCMYWTANHVDRDPQRIADRWLTSNHLRQAGPVRKSIARLLLAYY